MSPEAFVELVGAFRDAGYHFRSFGDFEPERCVILRHDVDFSPQDAARMAATESELGVSATYFVLLGSSFYNPLGRDTKACLDEIAASGGRLALHFDPSIHDDIDRGFERERGIFEETFGTRLDIVSLHRPRGFLEQNNRKLPAGVRHTYEDRYFKEIEYIADSGGSFAYGHPIESEAFRGRKTIHLNLHPIWWMREGSSPSEKLRSWQREYFEGLNEEVGRNCKTFDGTPFWRTP